MIDLLIVIEYFFVAGKMVHKQGWLTKQGHFVSKYFYIIIIFAYL